MFGVFGVFGVFGMFGIFGVFGMLAPATRAHISFVFAFVLAAKTGVKMPASNSTTVKLLSMAKLQNFLAIKWLIVLPFLVQTCAVFLMLLRFCSASLLCCL